VLGLTGNLLSQSADSIVDKIFTKEGGKLVRGAFLLAKRVKLGTFYKLDVTTCVG
jgi:hypothetical protein